MLPGDETISGLVADKALNQLFELEEEVVPGVIGEMVTALLRKRDVLSSSRVVRSTYLLLGVKGGGLQH
jgi:hypothetical protein